MTNVKQVILDAADIVETNWAKGTYARLDTNCYCAHGALMKAAGCEFVPDEDATHEIDAFGAPIPPYKMTWPDWQDNRPSYGPYSEKRETYARAVSIVADSVLGRDLVQYNDYEADSAADVAALFRSVAASLED